MHVHNYIQYIPNIAIPLQYVIDMHCYQSISLIQDMVIVDVMKPQNNYIIYLTNTYKCSFTCICKVNRSLKVSLFTCIC